MQEDNTFFIGKIRSINNSLLTIVNKPIHKNKIIINNSVNQKYLIDDVVLINDNEIRLLWRRASKDNIIFSTSSCNENCIFCPQENDFKIQSNLDINRALISNLVKTDINYVTITGGEPTLIGSELANIVRLLLKKNSKALISILTNGMEFDNITYAKEVLHAGKSNIKFCIALHSDVPSLHDTITRVKGSYERTVLGILNLHRLGANIEIRIVLNKFNYIRLENIALSIIRYFPFISHIAFMGLELHGKAAEISNEIWINPLEYMYNLSTAVYIIKCRNIDISIYNLPFCLVSLELWPFLCDSISGWKKLFLPICSLCSKKSNCSGLFSTSKFQSPSIKPFLIT